MYQIGHMSGAPFAAALGAPRSSLGRRQQLPAGCVRTLRVSLFVLPTFIATADLLCSLLVLR